MKLTDIKNSPEVLAQLRWDLNPQNASLGGYIITSQSDLEKVNQLVASKAGYYFYVDVWNCQARLALMHNYANGNGQAQIIEDYDNTELLESSVDCITCSGHYPITTDLEDDLRRKIYTSDLEAIGGEWTAGKDALRKQLNREYAKFRRDSDRVRKYSPKRKSTNRNKQAKEQK